MRLFRIAVVVVPARTLDGVDEVTGLTRERVGIGVGAVATLFRVPFGERARFDRRVVVAEPVVVIVEVVGGRHFLVGALVAVVVELVTGLGEIRGAHIAVVVAVLAELHPREAGLALLRRARLARSIRIALAVSVGVDVERGQNHLVDVAVAVLVGAITRLGDRLAAVDVRVDGRIHRSIDAHVGSPIEGHAAQLDLDEAFLAHHDGIPAPCRQEHQTKPIPHGRRIIHYWSDLPDVAKADTTGREPVREAHVIRRILTLLVIAMLLDVSSAEAQWWLITKGSPQAELLEARERVRTLLAQEGTGVLEEARIRAEFESQISIPPTFISQNQINDWVEQSRAALVSLANADYEDARQALLRAQELSQRAAEELNRETDRARAVLDTCLYMVRAFVETGDQDGAREQARNCRRLVPQIEPSRRRHTPEVRAILENLDQERDASPAAVLRVESTPSNCVVRLNGIQVGRTPFAMPDLARGEYRVQVECGESRGRVHQVSLRDEVVHLNVDTVFDQEMHSRPVYVDDNPRADSHAATLASKVHATIVMVSRESGGYRLTRFERDWRSSSRVVPFDGLEQAVQQIVSQESGDAYAPPEEIRYTPPVPGWRVGVGAGLLAAGVGLSIAAAAVHVQRAGKGELYVAVPPGDGQFLDRQRAWQDPRTVVLALAMTGGGIAAFSIPAWMPNRQGVHWASWAVGGLGLIGGGTALALTLSRASCPEVAADMEDDRQACVDRDRRGGIAAILGGASLTLLAVPVVDALQRDPTSNETVSLQLAPHAGRGNAGLTLRGEF